MADDQEPQDWLSSGGPSEGDAQPQQPQQPQQAWQTQQPLPAQQARSGSSRRRWAGAGLVAAGLVAGGVMAGTLGASAASSTSPAATYSPGGYATGSDADRPGDYGHGHGLDLSGTVTAVGTSSVTVKTSSGTKAYAVSSSSDIDKNGEAQLSSLAVGDVVRFSTTTSGSTVTIDKLHAGNETLDRPQGGPTEG